MHRKIREGGMLKNGKLEGIEEMYYQSGVLKQTATYKNGNRDGISKNYLENGALKQETSYKNGKRDGGGKPRRMRRRFNERPGKTKQQNE